jgi:hypothetical protein
MKADVWRSYLEEQRDRHGKVLFTLTELTHVAGATAATLNVELARLRRRGVIARYGHGLYGMPGAVSPQLLVAAIDSHAYVTGHYALYCHQMVTQVPVAITCFSDRRSPRARERVTPLGRLSLVCVRSRVYTAESAGAVASPAQAFCDFVYLSRRRGAEPEALVTLRNLTRIQPDELARILGRYPESVQTHVQRLLSFESRGESAAESVRGLAATSTHLTPTPAE